MIRKQTKEGSASSLFGDLVSADRMLANITSSKNSALYAFRCSRIELVPQLKKDGTPQKRTPNKFAMFVKENFARVKKENEGFAHKDVMKQLSADFAKLSTS